MLIVEEREMQKTIDGTKVAPHGLFYMENAGGAGVAASATEAPERQPSCFALEEEKGESWSGTGATKPVVNESQPSL